MTPKWICWSALLLLLLGGCAAAQQLFDIKPVADGVYAAIAKPAYKVNCAAAIVMFDDSVLVVDTHSKPSTALREKCMCSFLQLLGAGCLVVVVLTHVSEALHLFPWMYWGLEHSVGHYLDLWSAVLGLTLFPIGYLLHALTKRHP